MCRVGFVPSLLCAELPHNLSFVISFLFIYGGSRFASSLCGHFRTFAERGSLPVRFHSRSLSGVTDNLHSLIRTVAP